MSLTESIVELSLFSELDSISSLIPELEKLDRIPLDPAEDEIIEAIRKRLKVLLHINIKKEGRSLADVVFNTLLDIAKLKPLNIEDPISREDILIEDSIFISTGHQYSITHLIRFHNTRAPRFALNETIHDKWLIDPMTNIKFSTPDSEHIKSIATNKGIVIDNLKTNRPSPSHYSFLPSDSPLYRRATPLRTLAHSDTSPAVQMAARGVMGSLLPLSIGTNLTILFQMVSGLFDKPVQAPEPPSP